MDQTPPTTAPQSNIDTVAYAEFVASLIKPPEAILATLTPDKANMLHMLVGLTGEASGELSDAIKKHVMYNQSLDTVMCEKTGATIEQTIKEELGDIAFYFQGLLNQFGLTLEDVQTSNKAKLRKRYEKGYSDQAAKARADKA